MKSIHEYIREFARVLAAEKLELHKVRISFEAPPKDSLEAETLDIKKKKQFEANFMWRRYSIVVATSDQKKWYTYIVELDPWGPKRSESAEVIASRPHGEEELLLKSDPIEVMPKEIEAMFPQLLKGPNFNPNLPVSMVTYVNGHKKDKGKEYSPTEFKEIFENTKTSEGQNFYILLTKTNELKTPFGKTIGKVPEKS